MWNAKSFERNMAVDIPWIEKHIPFDQGCQMVYFQTQNTNLGTFLTDVCIFYGHLVYFKTL
jgi:hypothetical protein